MAKSASLDLETRAQQRMGLCPNFFLSGEQAALEHLFQQAEYCYLDAPFPAVFKEMLFTYLSRYCETPYCLLRHGAFLTGRGYPAGAADAPTLSTIAFIRLLQENEAEGESLRRHVETLEGNGLISVWPKHHTEVGQALFQCSVALFVQREQLPQVSAALLTSLGQKRYERLVLFLSFIRTAHDWAATHDVPVEQDILRWLEDEPDLERWLENFDAWQPRQAPQSPEQQRLAVLRSYNILDTEDDEAFNKVARVAARVCGVPIALISFVDEERQWFKSRVNWEGVETLRKHSFCTYTIQGQNPFVIENALDDDRFTDNPLVTGDHGIRFYAGFSLRMPEEQTIGSLCVLDRQPHQLSSSQIEAMEVLRDSIVSLLVLRRNRAEHRGLDALNLVCAWCSNVGVDGTGDGRWMDVMDYVRTQRSVTHGICPGCAEQMIKG